MGCDDASVITIHQGTSSAMAWPITTDGQPFRAGSVYPAAWLPDLVARRNAMNTWLASAMGGRNRYVATAGPLTGADGYLRPECDSGDGLHVSTWAHVLIADAIPLSLDTL